MVNSVSASNIPEVAHHEPASGSGERPANGCVAAEPAVSDPVDSSFRVATGQPAVRAHRTVHHIVATTCIRTLWCMAVAAVVWMVFRRSAQAFTQPLAAWSVVGFSLVLALTGLSLAVLPYLARRPTVPGHRRSADGSPSIAAEAGHRWTDLATVLMMSVVTAAVSLPGASLFAWVLPWAAIALTILAASLAVHRWSPADAIKRLISRVSRRTPDRAKSELTSREISESSEAIKISPDGDLDLETPLPHGVEQQLCRGRSEVGKGYVTGRARVQLPAGRRPQSHLHLAICPPLSGDADFEVEQQDGPSADVELGLCVPHGVRIDVRLAEDQDVKSEVIVVFYGEERESA